MSNGPPPLPSWTTPEPKKRSRWPLLITGLFAAAVIGSVGTGVYVHDRTPSVRKAENASAVREETRAVFAATAPVAADPDAEAFVEVLTRFSNALRAHDVAAGERVLDVDRLFDELFRLEGMPRPPLSKLSSVKKGFRQGVLNVFSTRSAMSPWERTDIRLIKRLDTPDDVVLTVRLQMQPGLVQPMRFWLHRNGGWRVYDWEDLSFGLRATTLMGRIANDPTPDIVARINALKDGNRELNAGNVEAAEKTFSSIKVTGLPADIRAAVLASHGSALLQLGRVDEGLTQLIAAEQANTDAPMVQVLLSAARNRNKEFDGAERAARRAIELLGPDGLSSYNLGHALFHQGRADEAEKALRRGLAADPESVDCMAQIAEVLPPQRQAEVGDYFVASQFTRATFRSLCGLLEKKATVTALLAVTQAYEKFNGTTIDGDLYRAGALFLNDDPATAAKITIAHLTTNDPYWKDAVLERYLQAMIAAGHALDGYRAARSPDAAFAYLAPKLDGNGADRLLDELIAVHTAARPQDYLGWQWQGFAAMRDKRYADADTAYVQALDRCPDPERQKLLRYRAVAWYHLGKVEQAYRELTGGKEGFARLGRLCGLNEDADGMEKLVAAHRAAMPDDPALVFRDGCVAFLRHQNVNALAAFRRFRDVAPDHDLAEPTTNYIVRALARENDQQGLRDEAARLVNAEVSAFSEVLIYAALGDAGHAASAATRFTRESPDESLLTDSDLAAVLARSDRTAVQHAIAAATQPSANATTTQPTTP